MRVNKTKFKGNSSLESYHMIYIRENKTHNLKKKREE